MHILCTSDSTVTCLGPAVQQCIMSWCSKSVKKKKKKETVVPPGGPVQRCSQGTMGAPAASNPHSCSPGLEPLQSPAVLPAMGTARLGGGGGGGERTNNNNIQHAGPGSDANRDPPHHSTKTWTGARTQRHTAAWESGVRRGEVGLWVATAFQVSFHFLLNSPPPPPSFWGWWWGTMVCRVGYYYAGGRDRSLGYG